MRIKDSRQTKKNKVQFETIAIVQDKKETVWLHLYFHSSTIQDRQENKRKKIKEMIVDEKKTCAIVICGTHAKATINTAKC